jgi:hypothetical protein
VQDLAQKWKFKTLIKMACIAKSATVPWHTSFLYRTVTT